MLNLQDRHIIHPFLFALFPVLSLYDHNKSELLVDRSLGVVVVLTLAALISFSLLLWSLLNSLTKDENKAALVVSLSLALFLSYGHVYYAIEDLRFHLVTSRNFGPNSILLPTWSIFFLLGARFFISTHRKLDGLTVLLNRVTVFLVAIPLINIGLYYIVKTRPHLQGTSHAEDVESSAVREETKKHPDIYYIILDRYASARSLKEFYNYDNQGFIGFLSRKGFYCAQESASNYLTTAHSLASSLNMEYLDVENKNSDDLTLLYKLLQDHRVGRFLRSKGYKFIHFGSWWHPTSRNDYADINLNWYPLPEFAMALIKTTLVHPLFRARLGLDNEQVQRKRVPFVFDQLAEIPKMKEPTFVFAHMLIPHPPYVFDRDGRFPGYNPDRRVGRITSYVNQLVFLNKKLKVLVGKLLSDSADPPVIILQGDEGPYPERYKLETSDFNWKRASGAEVREKMRILNAYYLPKADKNNPKDDLYPSITPVNSFRVIFNEYFNEDLRLLPDENYAYVDLGHPYDFFDVTRKIKQEEK